MTFHVRIFFFGLIAFAVRNGITNVVLMDRPPHLPFLVFDGGQCSPPCGQIKIDTMLWPGWQLAGEQIEIPPLTAGGGPTGGVVVEPPASLRQQGSHAPNNPKEAEDFAWVTQMTDVVGSGFKFNEDCLKPNDLTKCGRLKTLAGRIALQVGPLKTCSHVSAKAICNEPGVLDGINEYTFFRTSPEISQTLAEVVVLVADVKVGGNALVIKAYKSGHQLSRFVALPGTPCASGRCIDLFVGNVQSTKVDCPPRRIGDDFRAYYDFFVTKPLPHQQPIPIANMTSHPVSLEPPCRMLPLPPPLAVGARAATRDTKAVRFFFHSAASRPVCMMTVF